MNCANIQNAALAYFNADWISFNEDYFHLKAERIDLVYKGAKLECVLYKNEKGKYCLPGEDRYISIRFLPSSTSKEPNLYSQRLNVIEQLAYLLSDVGFNGSLALPPGFTDLRPFVWNGYHIGVGYTFISKLPIETLQIDSSINKNIRKAERGGYKVTRTLDWEKIVYCYNKTREYKNLGKFINVQMLEKLESKLKSNDFLIAHIAEDCFGNPVLAQIKLFVRDGICIDWVAGTDRAHIASGVNQLAYSKTIEELSIMGGKYFDYCGANERDVAMAKSRWGMELVPYFTISNGGFKEKLKASVKRNKFLSGVYRKTIN